MDNKLMLFIKTKFSFCDLRPKKRKKKVIYVGLLVDNNASSPPAPLTDKM